MKGNFTVSGRGFDHPAENADLGLSFAINLGSRASQERAEATFYVRDPDGNCVGRVDSLPDGTISIYGPEHFRAVAA
jgi:hypothetical protein